MTFQFRGVLRRVLQEFLKNIKKIVRMRSGCRSCGSRLFDYGFCFLCVFVFVSVCVYVSIFLEGTQQIWITLL